MLHLRWFQVGYTPEPEPTAPPENVNEQWEFGNVTAITTFPHKVTHTVLPALLTE